MRGAAIPAGLLAAGVSAQSHAAVPASLVQSIVRTASGLTAGEAASVLGRGVLINMLLSSQMHASILPLSIVLQFHLQ